MGEEITNMSAHSLFRLAVSTLLIQCLAATPWTGTEASALSEKLRPEAFDRLVGMDVGKRVPYLESLGVARDVWVAEFRAAVGAYLADEPGVSKDAQLLGDVLFGALLSDLLRMREASEPLRRLAASAQTSDAVAYSALLALEALGERELLLRLMAGRDARLARLAILVLGPDGSPSIRRRISAAGTARGDEPGIGDAVQLVELYHHDVEAFEKLSSDRDRIVFLEERLRRAYNPVNGMTQFWDPYSAGHPVSRWAMHQWREIAEQEPGLVSEHFATIHDYPSEETSEEYRAFLTRIAGLEPSLLTGRSP